MTEVSLRSEVAGVRDLLMGSIDRMVCTDSVEELERCAYFACKRITGLDDLKHRLPAVERMTGREERWESDSR